MPKLQGRARPAETRPRLATPSGLRAVVGVVAIRVTLRFALDTESDKMDLEGSSV